MNVRVFKNISRENVKSMEVYSRNILKYMPKNVSGFTVKAGNLPIIKHYFDKEFLYPKVAGANQADINHVIDHSYGGLLRYLDGKRTVITCHDLIPLQRKEESSWFGRRRFCINVGYLNKAERIIAVSECTKRAIVQFFGYSEEKIRVVYNGVSENFKPLDNSQLKEELLSGYSARKIIIIHVGTPYPRKNIELILRMLLSCPDLILIKVGTFTTLQNKFIKENKLASRIRVFSSIDSDERLAELYNTADVLIMPSFAEGFGMPVLEALACGIPVVCSDIEVFREIYFDAVEFADPYDPGSFLAKIKQLVDSQQRKQELKIKGIAKTRNFSWEKAAKETYAIYEEIYNEISSD